MIEKLRGDKNNDGLKDRVKEIDIQTRAEEIVANRRKSSDQRELERDYKEIEEQRIKEALAIMRKRRQHDIDFNHNPLATKFIMGKSEWEILKERHLFANKGNMFSNQKNIFVPKRKRR